MAAILVGLTCSSQLWAGTVRSVYTDESTMVPINLRMGHSTVLRFLEKPKKVILGNSNYYSIEFIDNDVAVQPLGTVATNFFVYGTKNVYGFLLKTETQGKYDDLVHVHWKEALTQIPTKAVIKLSPIKEVSRPEINFKVANILEVTIHKILRFEKRDFYILDLGLKNISKSEFDLTDFHIEAIRNKLRLTPQEFVVRDSHLKPGQTTSIRFLIKTLGNSDFTLKVRFKNFSGHQLLSRRYL